MDRGRLGKVVGHLDRDILALLEARHRTRRGAVEANAVAGKFTGINDDGVNRQGVFAGHGGAKKRHRETDTEHAGPADQSEGHFESLASEEKHPHPGRLGLLSE